MVHCPAAGVAGVLTAAAAALDAAALDALSARLTAPLRVAVRGRPGAGRRTVTRALRGAGVVVAADAGDDADIDVYVFVETLTADDRAALVSCRRPVVAVLNKADLSGFGAAGPMAAAAERCRELQRDSGVPTRPLAALPALAASDGLDAAVIGALRDLAIDPARLSAGMRRRLAAELDLFGIAHAATALHAGAHGAEVAAVLLGISGMRGLLDEITRAAAPVRYRRLVDAVGRLSLAGLPGARAAEFVGGEELASARMTAALEVVCADGLRIPTIDGRVDELRRAVHWERYAGGPVSDLHRSCARDIARGALRLWLRGGGVAGSLG